jgi:LPXTG-motif cell wall-anchored protein
LPGIPVGDPRCIPVPPTVPPTTPTTSSLPQTGIETGLLGVIGSSAMTIGTLKYLRSKKAVKEALRNIS